MDYFFKTFLTNLVGPFKGKRLLWHGLAILLTILIVTSDFDWQYFTWTRSQALTYIALPAAILGAFLPVLIPLILFLIGKIKKSRRIIMNGWALGQAALLGWVISSIYKVFTGRIPPPTPFNDTLAQALTNSSHGFQFGFWRGGIFWGWPSSHTTVAFATMVCLIMLHPKNKTLIFFAFLYALYIGLGVSVTIHWFSEFVAGAIIGSVIGVVVGRSFRKAMSA